MSTEQLNASKYIDALQEVETKICQEAFGEATRLLKERKDCGDNYFVAGNWDDDNLVGATFIDGYGNNADLDVFGLGLDENNNLLVAGIVCNIGYGHSDEDFPQEWTDAKKLQSGSYPALYYFVVSHLGNTLSKEDADQIAASMWQGSGDEDYDEEYYNEEE